MNDAPDFTTPSDSDVPVMSRDIAKLIVELMQKINAAYVEADEARADAAAVREQRGILMQQVHELERHSKRKDVRIATLCDENRSLREQIRQWSKVAA